MKGIVVATALSIIWISVSAQPAQTSDKTGMVTTYGLGQETCGDYKEARRIGNEKTGTSHGDFYSKSYAFEQYASGYLTSTSLEHEQTLPTSNAGIMGWFDNYCQVNPEQAFSTALYAYGAAHLAIKLSTIYRCPLDGGKVEYARTPRQGCVVIISPSP